MVVDLLLLGTIIAVAAAGFFQGTIKLLLALLMFYASLILAGLYYNFVALALIQRRVDVVLAQTASFVFILFLGFMLLLAAAVYTFRYVRLPTRIDVLDRLLGTGVGMVLGFVLSSILALLLRYAFISHSLTGSGGFVVASALQGSARNSSLIPLLLNQIFPQVYALVSPFLPEAALVLFSPGA
jgi:membrane protein required for colicin V production